MEHGCLQEVDNPQAPKKVMLQQWKEMWLRHCLVAVHDSNVYCTCWFHGWKGTSLPKLPSCLKYCAAHISL